MLSDLAASEPGWQVVMLRYFNPIGARPSGRIGEDPTGVPSNLMPFAMQMAIGPWERLTVFGGYFPTRDDTAARDHIHVLDLPDGHPAALGVIDRLPGVTAVNLGAGVGYSVLEVVAEASRAVGKAIP